MLQFHRTNLMSFNSQTVVNTVNTVGIMGKGIAAEYKKRFPEMFAEYKGICKRGELDPGGLWLWKGKDQWVLNFATKKHWRSPSKIEYLERGLQAFREQYEEFGVREIAFPRLGCGNGGLDWNVVRPLMVSKLSNLPITIYINDFEKPIGPPEHDLPLLRVSQPSHFESFRMDLQNLIEERHGVFRAIYLDSKFQVFMNEDGDLLGENDLVAATEDLHRLWTLALDVPVSRFDLPCSAHENALKLISVIAELPYARAVNIASRRGRNSLAIEFTGSRQTEAIPSQFDRVRA